MGIEWRVGIEPSAAYWLNIQWVSLVSLKR